MDEPAIVRKEDGSFQVVNLDLEKLTLVQRIGWAAVLWPSVKAQLEASGEYREGDPKAKFTDTYNGIGKREDIDKALAPAMGLSFSSLNRVRVRLLKNAEVRQKAIENEYESAHDVARALGMHLRVKLSEGRPSEMKPDSIIFGRGDRFDDVITPISRYLTAWEKRDYEFTHVNPREAKRRLLILQQLTEQLDKVKEDLGRRSHEARLSLRSTGRRKENA